MEDNKELNLLTKERISIFISRVYLDALKNNRKIGVEEALYLSELIKKTFISE